MTSPERSQSLAPYLQHRLLLAKRLLQGRQALAEAELFTLNGCGCRSVHLLPKLLSQLPEDEERVLDCLQPLEKVLGDTRTGSW